MEPLLTAKGLAEKLGLAEQTIYNRNSNGGDLPPSIKIPGGHPKSPSDGHFKIPQ